jgi:hypothetical protein
MDGKGTTQIPTRATPIGEVPVVMPIGTATNPPVVTPIGGVSAPVVMPIGATMQVPVVTPIGMTNLHGMIPPQPTSKPPTPSSRARRAESPLLEKIMEKQSSGSLTDFKNTLEIVAQSQIALSEQLIEMKHIFKETMDAVIHTLNRFTDAVVESKLDSVSKKEMDQDYFEDETELDEHQEISDKHSV